MIVVAKTFQKNSSTNNSQLSPFPNWKGYRSAATPSSPNMEGSAHLRAYLPLPSPNVPLSLPAPLLRSAALPPNGTHIQLTNPLPSPLLSSPLLSSLLFFSSTPLLFYSLPPLPSPPLLQDMFFPPSNNQTHPNPNAHANSPPLSSPKWFFRYPLA